jgi:hypothetical protein
VLDAEETIMATQATMRDRQQRRTGIRTQMAMTAISLAVLGGFVLWQVRPSGDEAVAPAAGGITPPASVPALANGSGRSLTEQPRRSGLHTNTSDTLDDALTELDGEQTAAVLRSVYLVGSEVAATAARQLAAGADQVHVVETEEDASQVRVGLSRPGTEIIDLRTPAAGATGHRAAGA